MKKLVTIILALSAMAVFAACGNNTSEADKDSSESSQTQQITMEESTAAETTAIDTSSQNNRPVVDIDALKKIEANDDFAVKISDAKLTKEYFLNSNHPPMARQGIGDDAVEVTFDNNSNQTITVVDAYFIGYAADGTARKLRTEAGTSFPGEEKLYSEVGYSGDIQPSESKIYICETDLWDVQGVCYIVSSYTADGKEVKNPKADEWLKSIYKK